MLYCSTNVVLPLHSIPISTYCYSLESTYSIPRPCTRFQTPSQETSSHSNMQSHRCVSPTFPPSWPATQRYPSPVNSPCTNYVFALYSHTPPLFGAIYHPTIIANCKFHSPNVSASLATSPGAPPYHLKHPSYLRLHLPFANIFDRCPAHPNPLVRSIGNYSLADLHHQYKKYIRNALSTFSSNHFPPTTELHFGQSDHTTHPTQT
jgi:hypothetical protein